MGDGGDGADIGRRSSGREVRGEAERRLSLRGARGAAEDESVVELHRFLEPSGAGGGCGQALAEHLRGGGDEERVEQVERLRRDVGRLPAAGDEAGLGEVEDGECIKQHLAGDEEIDGARVGAGARFHQHLFRHAGAGELLELPDGAVLPFRNRGAERRPEVELAIARTASRMDSASSRRLIMSRRERSGSAAKLVSSKAEESW